MEQIAAVGEIRTQRNKKKLEHEGFLYVYHNRSKAGDRKFWRCEFNRQRNVNCRGRVHTDMADVVQQTVGQHTCNNSAANVIRKRIVTDIKRRARQCLDAPSEICSLELQKVSPTVLATFPSRNAVRKMIERIRNGGRKNAQQLALPASIRELDIPEQYQHYNSGSTTMTDGDEQQQPDGERFLLADSGVYTESNSDQRILIFGRESVGDWSDQMQEVFVDTALSVTPFPFYHTLIIFTRRGNWVLPVLYCLLTSKTAAAYERALRMIVQCWPKFAPTFISVDLDTAIINATKGVFPAAALHSEFFHLLNTMKSQLTERELIKRYNTDPEFALLCKMITSIAFLPIADITLAIHALETLLPPEIQSILDWFLATYTGRPRWNGTRTQPLFVPEMWSVHEMALIGDGDQINNAVEYAHRRLQGAFRTTERTSIWHFIDRVRMVQRQADAHCASFLAGEQPVPKAKCHRDADRRILDAVRRYLTTQVQLQQQQPLSEYGGNNSSSDTRYINAQPIIDALTEISNNY